MWTACAVDEWLLGSAEVDQAVRAVLVLLEVRCVTTWVANTMLGQEHAVCVVSPAWASPSDVCWTKSCRQHPVSPSLPNVLDEPTHSSSIARRLRRGQHASFNETGQRLENLGIDVPVIPTSLPPVDIRLLSRNLSRSRPWLRRDRAVPLHPLPPRPVDVRHRS